MGGDNFIMSEAIDQRTVEMRFDNHQFEKNIESSLGSIDKLKRSLNFKDSVSNIDQLGKSLASLGQKNLFSGVSDSLKDFAGNFNNFFDFSKKLFYVREAQKLFDTVKDSLVGLTKSLSGIDQMSAGWDRYAKKTTSVKTIMNATGKSIDEVTKYLNKLNWYTDETSYDFADMVNNIGKFTSSGIDLKDAVEAMEGISNWAATSGQGKSEAARAMYNLSQAVSMGSVKMQDWKSIQLANMATKEFKETVLETGVAIGKLTKVEDKYYSTAGGKKREITAETFESTLQYGWFDSDLLVKTLQRYSKFTDEVYDYMQKHEEIDTASKAIEAMRDEAEAAGKEFDELGAKWFLSAQEARTFQDVVDSLKDALQTGWANTFELIFGNYVEVKDLWTNLANDLYEIFAGPGNERNDFLFDVMSSGYEKFKKEIVDAGLSVEEFEAEILKSAEANEETKETVDNLVKEYGSIGAALEAGKVPTDIVRDAFAGLTSAEKEGKKIIPALYEINKIVEDTWKTDKYGTGEERFEKYRELGYDPEKIQSLVALYGKQGKLTLEDIEAAGIEVGNIYSGTWKEFIENNEEFVDSLDEVSGRKLLIGGAYNILTGVFEGVKTVQNGLKEIFSITPEGVRNSLQSFNEFSEKMKIFIPAIFQGITSIGIVGKKVFDGIFGNTFDKVSGKFQSKLKNIGSEIYTFVMRASKVFKSLENSEAFNGWIKKQGEDFTKWAAEVKGRFGEYGQFIQNAFEKSYLGKKLGSIKRQWLSVWNEVNANGGNAFDNLSKAWSKFKENWIKSHGENFDYFSSIKEGLKKDFESFKKYIEKFEIGKKLVDLFNKFAGRPEGTELDSSNFLSGIKDGIIRGLEKLLDSIKNFNIKDKINGLFKGIFEDSSKKEKPKRVRPQSKFDEYVEKYIARRGEQSGKNTNVKGAYTKDVQRQSKEIAEESSKALEEAANNQPQVQLPFPLSLLSEVEKLFSSGALEKVKTKLKGFWGWLGPLLKQMAEGFAKDFNVSSLSNLILSLSALNVSKLFRDTGKGLKEFLQGGKFLLSDIGSTFKSYGTHGITKSISTFVGDMVKAVSPLKEKKMELRARSVLEFAAAVGIIAGAILLISKVPEDAILRSVIVVGGITAALVAIGFALSAMGNIQFKMAFSGTVTILKLIALIISISIALKNVGRAAQGIAEAVNMLTDTAEKFSDLAGTKVKFQEGISAIQDLILSLGLWSGLSGLIGGIGNIFGGPSVTILALAVSAKILFSAVKQFVELGDDIDQKKIEQSIDIINKLFKSLAKTLFKTSFLQNSGNPLEVALKYVSLAVAIKIIQSTLIDLADVPAKDLRAATDSVKEVLYFIGNAAFWSGLANGGGLFGLGSFGKAADILSFGITIKLIFNTIKDIMEVSADPARFEKAKATVINLLEVVTAFSVVSGILRKLKFGASLGQALTIIGFGNALKMIAGTLASLAEFNSERLDSSIKALWNITGMMVAFMAAMDGLQILMKFMKMGNTSIINDISIINSFANTMRTIVTVIQSLSGIPESDLDKGVRAAWHVVGITTVIVGISTAIGKLGGKLNLGGVNVLAMASSMLAISKAIEKLGSIDSKTLDNGTNAIVQLATILTLATVLMNVNTNMLSWTNSANIIAIAAGILIVSRAAETFASMDSDQLKRAGVAIAGTLAAIFLITKIRFPDMGGFKTLIGSLQFLIIGGLVAALAEFAKTFKDMEWVDLGKVGATFLGLITAFTLIIGLSKLAKFADVGGILKLGGVIALVGGVLMALGGIMKIDGVKGLMQGGGDFIGLIGEAIGKFVGGIVSGTSKGVEKALADLGSGLTQFAENSQAFWDLIRDIGSENLADTLGGLALALAGLEIDQFIHNINSWFSLGKEGFQSLADLGTGLQKLAPGIFAINMAMSMSGGDPNSLYTTMQAIKTLSDTANDQQFVEGNPLQDFAKKIVAACTDLTEAIGSLNSLPTVNGNAEAVVEALRSISEISMPENAEAMLDTPFFRFATSVKKTSFASLAGDLSSSIGDLTTFINGVNELDFQYHNNGKLKTTVFADMIAGLTNIDLKPSGGLITKWSDYSKAFQTLAKDLVSMFDEIEDTKDSETKKTNLLEKFINGINNLPKIDEEKFSSLLSIFTEFSKIQTPMQDQEIWMTPSSFIRSYSDSISEISLLSDEIDNHSDEIEKVRNLASIFETGKELNTTKLEGLPKVISKFVTDVNAALNGATIDQNLANFVYGLSELLYINVNTENMSEITSAALAFQSAVLALAIGYDDTTKALEAMNVISLFVDAVNSIQNKVDKKQFESKLTDVFNAISGKSNYATSTAIAKLNQLTSFFNSVKNFFNLNLKQDTDNDGITDLQAKFNSLSDALDQFAPKVQESELNTYIGWIESLSGKKDTFKQAGEALMSFIPDTTRFDSLTNFINALKGEFAFSPGKYEITEDWDGPKTKETLGYFRSIGHELVLMDEELATRDFTETDKVTEAIQKFATGLGQIKRINAEEIKQKLRDAYSAINDATLGEGDEESKKIATNLEKTVGVLDTINNAFDKIRALRDEGLETVIPGILTGISTAINSFTYSPENLELLTSTISQIAQSLGILDGDGNLVVTPTSGVKGGTTPGSNKRIRPQSKADQIARKYPTAENTNITNYDISSDELKEEYKGAFAEALSEAMVSALEASGKDLAGFVKSIADSIKSNSGETSSAANKVVDDMLRVFESKAGLFINVGSMFVKMITAGMMMAAPIAMTAASNIASAILGRFSEAGQTQGAGIGSQMIKAITDSLSSEESKKSFDNAINTLFGLDSEETDLQVNPVTSEMGLDGGGPGYQFAQQFIKDMQQGLSDSSLSIADYINQTFAELGEEVDLTGFSEHVNEAVTAANEEIAEPLGIMRNEFQSIVPDGGAMVDAMVDGMIAALAARVGDACAAIGAFAGAVAAAANAALEINSPSKVFYRIGSGVVEGFILGVNKNAHSAADSVADAMELSIDQATYILAMLKKMDSFWYKGKLYTQKDVPFLTGLLNATRETMNEVKEEYSEASDEVAKTPLGGGGGGGGKKEEEEKSWFSKLLSGIDEVAKDLGIDLNLTDFATSLEETGKSIGDFFEALPTELMNALGIDTEGFELGWKDLDVDTSDPFGLRKDGVLGSTVGEIQNNTAETVSTLYSVKDDLASIIAHQSKPEELSEEPEDLFEDTGTGFTFNQTINSPSPMSASEIARKTSNMLSSYSKKASRLGVVRR